MRRTTGTRSVPKSCLTAIVVLALAIAGSAGAEEENPHGYTVKYSNGLQIYRNDGWYKVKLGGRIQADFATIHPTSLLNLAVPGGDGEGVEIRRARLYMSGQLFDRIIFKAQYDFASGSASFGDVYIGMIGLGPVGTVRVGNFKQPFGLQELTSSKYITFMERALPNVFDPGRNFGLAANNDILGERMTWALGIFAPSNSQGKYFSGSDAFDLTGRVTGLAYRAEDLSQFLHLGLSLSYQYAKDMNELFEQRPEAHLAQYYVDTGTFQRDNMVFIEPEIAWVFGPLSLQGEYTHVWIQQPAAPTAGLKGGYVEASYFLTGENREYKPKEGVFGRVTPKRSLDPANGGWGAWQIAVRYSALDLQDKNLNGGLQQDVTVGLNWQPFSNTRIMFNYVWADVQDSGDASRQPALPGLVNVPGKVNLFEARAQLEF